MCVLLPKLSIFISLGSGVPVDIKRATTNLNMLQETMLRDLQAAEGIYQNLFRGRFTNFHPFGQIPKRIMECSVEIEIIGFTAASRYVIFSQN